jgi:hypothetical protein
VPAPLREVLAGWEAARARDLARDFAGALAFFQRFSALDRPSAVYADWCRRFMLRPPPPAWNGQGEPAASELPTATAAARGE